MYIHFLKLLTDNNLQFLILKALQIFLLSKLNFISFLNLDTSASLASQTTSTTTTIKDHISITSSSHLDYQNVQNDGEFISAVQKQYHSSEMDADNDIGEEEHPLNSLNRGPYFDVSARNITAIAGQSAYLNCRVRNLGNKTVKIGFFGRLIKNFMMTFFLQVS